MGYERKAVHAIAKDAEERRKNLLRSVMFWQSGITSGVDYLDHMIRQVSRSWSRLSRLYARFVGAAVEAQPSSMNNDNLSTC